MDFKDPEIRLTYFVVVVVVVLCKNWRFCHRCHNPNMTKEIYQKNAEHSDTAEFFFH